MAVSAVPPLVVPPNFYLQYLPIKTKNPQLPKNDAIPIAYTMDYYSSSQNVKVEAPESPLPMKQTDIEKILTTIVASPSSPVLGGYAQPVETPPMYTEDCCFCCGKQGHECLDCPNSPISSNSRCFCYR